MRTDWLHLSPYRVRLGQLRSTDADGGTGCFMLPGPHHRVLRMISSDGRDGTGWEHVSASCPKGTPSWAEMAFVKALFWEDEECVMQLHPPKSQYVNNHPFVLHLWRPVGVEIPRPPALMVGVQGMAPEDVVNASPETVRRIERQAYMQALAEGWLS